MIPYEVPEGFVPEDSLRLAAGLPPALYSVPGLLTAAEAARQ
jgi:hypothetical protein